MITQRLGAEEGDTPVEQQPAAMQDFDPTYDRCGSDSVIRRCRLNVRFARERICPRDLECTLARQWTRARQLHSLTAPPPTTGKSTTDCGPTTRAVPPPLRIPPRPAGTTPNPLRH